MDTGFYIYKTIVPLITWAGVLLVLWGLGRYFWRRKNKQGDQVYKKLIWGGVLCIVVNTSIWFIVTSLVTQTVD